MKRLLFVALLLVGFFSFDAPKAEAGLVGRIVSAPYRAAKALAGKVRNREHKPLRRAAGALRGGCANGSCG